MEAVTVTDLIIAIVAAGTAISALIALYVRYSVEASIRRALSEMACTYVTRSELAETLRAALAELRLALIDQFNSRYYRRGELGGQHDET